MNKFACTVLCVLLTCGPAFGQDLGEFRILHEFDEYNFRNKGPQDGNSPNALVSDGSRLYGTTSGGGYVSGKSRTRNNGTIFSVNADGTDYRVLHRFDSSEDRGSQPIDLVLEGNRLVGITNTGGAYNSGVLFAINTDGSGFRVLHEFGVIKEEAHVYANPQGFTRVGSTLYVTNFKSIYAINTDGSGLRLLKLFPNPFSDKRIDGWELTDRLALGGSTLYGVSYSGGERHGGTIFAINTDGTGFRVLHHFKGIEDVSGAAGPLSLVGSTLYGSTGYAIYSINTDGSDLRIRHTFGNNTGNCNRLTLHDSRLYGATDFRVNTGEGALFSIKPDGTDVRILHGFKTEDDKEKLQGMKQIIVAESTLFGASRVGGTGGGVVFALVLPEQTPDPPAHPKANEREDGLPLPDEQTSATPAHLKPDEREENARASVDGKYQDLLHKIHVPDDEASYGELRDYGYSTTSSWGGHDHLSPGYWVYISPHWYIWARKGESGAANNSGLSLDNAVQWTAAAGGNGHHYLAVVGQPGISWHQAQTAAKEAGGYLVTITSKEENDFVFSLIANKDAYWYRGSYGPWIGGIQSHGAPDASAGWAWATGEPFRFAKWDAEQPNDWEGRNENRIMFYKQSDAWNDVGHDFDEITSYVIEFDAEPK